MRSLLIALALFLSCLSGRTQQVVDVGTTDFDATNHRGLVNNVMGQLYQPIKYVKVTAGSPLVKAVQFTDSASGAQFMFVLGEDLPKAERSLAKTWFQVLVNDTVSLCRQIKKSIHETIAYGTSTTEQDIVTADLYFVQIKGVFSRVKTWADLIQLFSDKKDQIDQYVHAHHLKGKSVEDYTQLVQFYNSIKNV